MHQAFPALLVPRLTLFPKRQMLIRTALPKSSPLPPALLRKLNKLRPLKKEKTQLREWFLKLLNL